jgi:hypothetical protein
MILAKLRLFFHDHYPIPNPQLPPLSKPHKKVLNAKFRSPSVSVDSSLTQSKYSSSHRSFIMHSEGRTLEHNKALVLFLILVVILSFNLYLVVLRRSPIPSASALETGPNIGVYSDAHCTQSVSSINWGTIQLGETQEFDVYVRNEGNETQYLSVATLDWQPENAYLSLNFSWSCQNTTMAVGQVVKVIQTLHVPSDFAGGFSSFSFNIVFQGESYLLGDITHDGKVGLQDLQIIAAAYGSRPGDPNWNPAADLNKDGVVNLLDLVIVAEEYGQTD